MAFTEFCCRSGGSNLNAGTLTGNATEPSTTAAFTYASGTWVQSTGVFTVASGNPASDGVAVGDFASVYADGATVGVFIGRVTARDATTITVSLTAKGGTAPADGTNTRTLKIGGAWLGPNAASGFPLNVVQATLTNVAGDAPRVNMKNDATYSVTAAVSHSQAGPIAFQGYTTAYGDLGRAILDGGTGGTGYNLATFGTTKILVADLIFANNGASSGGDLVTATSGSVLFLRCVAHDSRSNGFSVDNGMLVECEAYACNKNGFGGTGGFKTNSGQVCIRCIAHDNGATGGGFVATGGAVHYLYIGCISESNGGPGFTTSVTTRVTYLSCDAYNNTGAGISNTGSTPVLYFENCNLVKNSGWGIDGTATEMGAIVNCGFGAGTQANSSGNIHTMDSTVEIGSVSYASNVTPWVDPANGDFRITLATAKGAGRGTFTQTAASYAGAIGFPDIGAAQHLEAASGGKGGDVRFMIGGVAG